MSACTYTRVHVSIHACMSVHVRADVYGNAHAYIQVKKPAFIHAHDLDSRARFLKEFISVIFMS